MALVYESAEFDVTPSSPVTLDHNLGYVPSVYSLWRMVDGEAVGWEPMGEEQMESGVYVESFTNNQATVKCRSGYTFTGTVKLMCWNG